MGVCRWRRCGSVASQSLGNVASDYSREKSEEHREGLCAPLHEECSSLEM